MPVRRKCKSAGPVVRADGAVIMRVGLILDACKPGLHVSVDAAERLGVKSGDYLQLDDDERGTQIVREVITCECLCPGMRGNYLYMDQMSFHYLLSDLHGEVTVKRAEYQMESP